MAIIPFLSFVFILVLQFFPAYSLAADIYGENVHRKKGDEQTCSTCHILNEKLKKDLSIVCTQCHEGSIKVADDNRIVSHMYFLNGHVINKPFPVGKYDYKIVADNNSVYVQYLNYRLPLFGKSLETASMECATCHDPHGESGISKMLRVDNSDGLLCEICHDLDKLKIKAYVYNDFVMEASFSEVHMRSGSKCNICHLSSNPENDSVSFKVFDQSRLCESCHRGTVTILTSNRLSSKEKKMNNHPVKFSPLDYSAEKINRNIVKDGTRFFVLGQKGRVPLFGETEETAIVECGTCHEPHGDSGIVKLQRMDNSEGQLCLICHLDIK